MLTLLHIGSRLFELFSKEVRVKKKPGRPLTSKRAKTHGMRTTVNLTMEVNLTRRNICAKYDLQLKKFVETKAWSRNHASLS